MITSGSKAVSPRMPKAKSAFNEGMVFPRAFIPVSPLLCGRIPILGATLLPNDSGAATEKLVTSLSVLADLC